jgi:hypothetical protein
MTSTEIDAIAGHIAVGCVRQYLARQADGLGASPLQLGTVLRRHFKLASAHYALSDPDQELLIRRLPWALKRLRRAADQCE